MGHPYCILEKWQAREVLQHLYQRYRSVRKLAEPLHTSKSTLHRCLRGEQSIPLVLRARLCEVLPEEELVRILKGKELLKKYGLLGDEGRLNRAVAIALLDAMMQEETLKEEVLGFLLKYYKKELQERLVEVLPRIELRWTQEFEKWLTEKKSKPISERTPKGLPEHLVQVFRGKDSGLAPHKTIIRKEYGVLRWKLPPDRMDKTDIQALHQLPLCRGQA